MSDSGGSIRTTWVFDASSGVQSAQQVKASLQGVQQPSEGLIKTFAQMEAELKGLTADLQKMGGQTKESGAAALSTAQAEARLAVALGNRRQAIEILEGALSGQQQRTVAVINAETQLTQIENQGVAAAQRATQATQQRANALGTLQQGLGAVGIGFGIQQVVQFETSAAKMALTLRETLNGLRAVSGSAHTYAEAVQTARQQQILFGGTLQENIEGLQGLVITARDSGTELQSLVDLSQRLVIKSPEQGATGARIAIANAFAEGNITSLSRRFNIPIGKIKELRDASIPAAEKVRILSDYLDSVGISSAAVAGRVDKTARTYREFTAALEGTKIALGDLVAAQGAGGAAGATGALTGITQLVGAYNQLAASSGQFGTVVSSILNPISTYNNAVLGAAAGGLKWAGVTFGLTDATRQAAGAFDEDRIAVGRAQLAHEQNAFALSKEAKEKLEDRIATAELAQQQKQLEADSIAAANGLLGAGDQALILAKKYGIATEQAQFLIQQQQALSNATALADQRVGERDPSNRLTAAQNTKFAGLVRARNNEIADDKKKADEKAAQEAKQAREKAAREAAQLQDAQNGLNLARAKTSAQKIAELQRQQAATNDPVEKIRLQTQIEQERNNIAKAHTSTLDKNLKLQEGTYDSLNKQRDALLDIEELTIKDRQTDRDDAKKLRTANAIQARLAGRTDARSLDFIARAQDAAALIDVQDRKRAFEIEQKQATVGGAIIKGRLFQSVQDGASPQPGASTGGAVPTSGTAAAAPAATTGQVITLRLVDSAGRTIAESVEPFIMDSLLKGVRAVAITKGA